MLPAAWGLDLGKSSLKAVKLQKVKDEVEIVSVAHIEYGAGEDARTGVRAALRTFLDTYAVKGDRIVVAMPGRMAFSRFIKLPPLEVKKLDEIVRYEAQQQIPFPIHEVVWDYQRLDGDDTAPGGEIEIGIFAIKKDLIQDFLSDLDDVKVKADVVTIAPLAIFNFVRFDLADLPQSLIVVDVGADHTDLLVVEGNRFWIRNLPLAGDDLTRALTDKFQVPFEEAERLKRTAAKSQQVKKIFSVMEPVLKDFVAEIHRSIGYYKAQSKQAIFKEMILLGDASKLVGLKNYLTQHLQLNVSRITRLNKLNLDEGVDVEVLRKHVGAFCTALGLGLQGIGAGSNDVNMVPQEVRQERAVAAKKPLFLMATGILAALIFILAMVKSHELKELKRLEARTEVVEELGDYRSKIRDAMKLGSLDEDLVLLEHVAGKRLLPVRAFQAVDRALPANTADMPRAVVGQDVNQVAKQANTDKVWLLRLDLQRRFEKKTRKESFFLVVGGAVLAEDTQQESLAKVDRLFLDGLAEELKVDPLATRELPDGWEDHSTFGPLKFFGSTKKQNPSFAILHYSLYFYFAREIDLTRVEEPEEPGKEPEEE